MKPFDFDSIWSSLDSDSKDILAPGILKRLVDPDFRPEMYLAITVPANKRILLVRMPDSWNEDISIYPRWKGLDIYVYRGEEGASRTRYLAISQGTQSIKEVFQSLIKDLVETILLSADETRVKELIHQRLNRWELFFEEQKQEGLSAESQQGLFGELKFLRDHLLPLIGYAACIRSWTGALRMSRDFQFAASAIEVKTTATKQHQKIVISNERQLDTSDIDNLYILFFPLEIVEEGGESLPQLVSAIAKILKHDDVSTIDFNNKLFEAGYLDVHAERYRRRYYCRKAKAYKIAEGFPRIVDDDLPNGVGDVSYSVMLSACERYEVPISQVLLDISKSMNGLNE